MLVVVVVERGSRSKLTVVDGRIFYFYPTIRVISLVMTLFGMEFASKIAVEFNYA